MGKYGDMLDDEDYEPTPEEVKEATAELYGELWGEQAGHWMREQLGLPPTPPAQ